MATADQRRLRSEVEREIRREALADIHVNVIDGRLVLTGVVDTVARKEAAERVAARIAAQLHSDAGVENDLTVEAPRGNSDRTLERMLDQLLAEVPDLPPSAVSAQVERGVAYLVGHVDSAAQAEAARTAALGVRGLKEVVSRVSIARNAPVEPVGLVNRVAEALSEDPRVRARQIEVSADEHGEVTLSGEVEHAADRDAAIEVARSVPGVHRVISRIEAPER